ncbi:MAG: phenylalanine--tRNA ligase subunit beta [Planctomycetota bacterium]
MLISLNWLSDYVDVAMPIEQLSELFMKIGLCVEDVRNAGDDIVVDLEVTSNRPDCLGHIGVARELAAATGAQLRLPAVSNTATSGNVAELTSVEVLDPDMCPRYTARVLRGVKVGPSPVWLANRLEAIGMRSVNNVVDVTNFILMEYSQPLHSFDYDKLAENRIVVRRAKAGEELVSIDETLCKLDESMLIIADAEEPVAVAGVMGGVETEVTESTTNILMESAQFDPLTTRRTSRKLQLMSESNFRFERGVDPVALDEASLRACEMIVDLAGGELVDGVVNVWAAPYEAPKVSLRPARCDALLGTRTLPARQVEILAALGLAPELNGDTIVCTIPPHRADLRREVDLIEEVARLETYDKIPVGRHIRHELHGEGLSQRTRRRAGEVLAAAGFDEAITFTFVDDDEAAVLLPGPVMTVDATVRRSNNALRKTLLNSLLRAAKANQDVGNTHVSLFEIAAIFPPDADAHLPAEHVELGMVTTGGLRNLRGAIETLVERITPLSTLTVASGDSAGLAAGAAATLMLDGEPLGAIGLIAHDVQDRYGLENTIAAAAVNFDTILANSDQQPIYQTLPRFPAMQRDLSLIVDDAVTWQQLTETIESVSQPMRVGLEYVTTYRGKPIPKGKKSITAALTYRSPDGTLRSEQVDEQIDAVVQATRTALDAELRV